MSNLKLANEVNGKLLSLVKQEREVLATILQMIARVDQLRLFVELGYRSLYEYLTKGLGYSEAAAQRRINGARLLREVPELLGSVKNGEINLSQMDMLASAAREFEKLTVNRSEFKRSTVDQTQSLQTADDDNTQIVESEKTHLQPKLSKAEIQKEVRTKKIELVQNLKGLNKKSSEVLIAQTFHLQPKEHVRVHHQADQSVRIEMTFTREQMELLQKARDLNSHALPFGSWDEFFLYLAKRSVQQRTASARSSKKKITDCEGLATTATATATVSETAASKSNSITAPTSTATGTVIANTSAATSASAAEANSTNSARKTGRSPKSLPALKRKWLRENGRCQYVDKQTGHKCNSTWQLELDHIQPKFAGGKDTSENLRLYCRHHNQLRYKIESSKIKTIPL